MKKLTFIIWSIISLSLVFSFAPLFTQASGEEISLALKYLYNFAISGIGLLMLVVLIRGGFQYLTSGASPVKLKQARKQIIGAFLGLTLVLSSYLIIDAINPELTILRLPGLKRAPIVELPDLPPLPAHEPHFYQEIPVGTLITSERSLSSFLAHNSIGPDPDTSSEEYPEAFPETWSFSTEYQGALHGRRLKRIHEAASTLAGPISELGTGYAIAQLFYEFKVILDVMRKEIDELHRLSMACSCSFCSCACGCVGETCPWRARMLELASSIEAYYIGAISPFQCIMDEIEFASRAIPPFLNEDYFVKNDEKQEISFWHSPKAQELIGRIEDCAAAGYLAPPTLTKFRTAPGKQGDGEVLDVVREMAEIELKGTHTPRLKPAERDIQTMIRQLEHFLPLFEKIENKLNPEHLNGCFPQPYSLTQFYQKMEILDFSPANMKIVPFEDAFGNVLVIDDIATFYCPIDPIIRPLMPFQLRDALSVGVLLGDKPEDIVCAQMVEIPIGTSIDQTVQLVHDILRVLGMPPGHPERPWDPDGLSEQGLWHEGHKVLPLLNRVVLEGALADQLFAQVQIFVDLTRAIPACPGGCVNPCCPRGCCCGCGALCPAQDRVDRQYKGPVQTAEDRVRAVYAEAVELKEGIYELFFKLHSNYPAKNDLIRGYPEKYLRDGKMRPHPRAGERAPIFYELCCQEKRGACRTPETDLVNVERRYYTLKEKLIEIQKLLNRSRDARDHIILLEELIRDGMAEQEELDYLKDIHDIRFSMSSCDISPLAQPKAGLPQRIFVNCFLAKPVNHHLIYADACNPEPDLNCQYFDDRVPEKKTRLLCHCYDDIFQPETASNFFCCSVRN